MALTVIDPFQRLGIGKALLARLISAALIRGIETLRALILADNAPVIGELRPGVFVATGHYRNGVLLAPATADAVADLVAGGPDAELVKPFGPERFGSRTP